MCLRNRNFLSIIFFSHSTKESLALNTHNCSSSGQQDTQSTLNSISQRCSLSYSSLFGWIKGSFVSTNPTRSPLPRLCLSLGHSSLFTDSFCTLRPAADDEEAPRSVLSHLYLDLVASESRYDNENSSSQMKDDLMPHFKISTPANPYTYILRCTYVPSPPTTQVERERDRQG